MYDITVTREFTASHALRLPGGAMEPSHSHHWRIQVTVEAEYLDAEECVMDFHDLEAMLDRLVLQADGHDLNKLAPFASESGQLDMNPSAERVAWWMGREVQRVLPLGVRLVAASVTEAPGCQAQWRP